MYAYLFFIESRGHFNLFLVIFRHFWGVKNPNLYFPEAKRFMISDMLTQLDLLHQPDGVVEYRIQDPGNLRRANRKSSEKVNAGDLPGQNGSVSGADREDSADDRAEIGDEMGQGLRDLGHQDLPKGNKIWMSPSRIEGGLGVDS